jgi:hypothetical protein
VAIKRHRLDPKVDSWVRKAVQYAKDLTDADYAAIDAALGKAKRWCRNVLRRPGTLAIEPARELMDWVEAVTQAHDKKSLGQVRFVKAQLRDTPRGLSSVPFLVLSKDIDRVTKAFDKYLEQRGRGSAKGLLRDFLVRPSLAGSKSKDPNATYARSCAWDLSWRVRGIIAARARSVSITSNGQKLTVRPDDLQALIYDLEYLVEPHKLPRATRADLRKAQRAAR